MKGHHNTLELARLYENQGYTADALEMYRALAEEGTSPEIKSAIERLSTGTTAVCSNVQDQKKEKIAVLMEEWVRLMAIGQRLARFKKIKDRLC